MFACVGALNTGIDLAIFAALVTFTTASPLLAGGVSYLCGSINSYLLNGRLTFRSRAVRLASTRRIVQFILVNLVCLAFSLGSLALFITFTPVLVAKLMSVLATFALSFILARTIVYAA